MVVSASRFQRVARSRHRRGTGGAQRRKLTLPPWLSGLRPLRPLFRITPAVIYAYFVPALSTSLGITPAASPAYGWMVRYLKSLARPMGRIHVDFGEPVRLDAAPDPEDQLAISKIAFCTATGSAGWWRRHIRGLREKVSFDRVDVARARAWRLFLLRRRQGLFQEPGHPSGL